MPKPQPSSDSTSIMKKLLTLLTLTALATAPATLLAAPKKAVEPAPAAPAAPAKPATPTVPAAKALGMFTKVDAIDDAAKTFSHTNKDGTVVKFMVTDTTEIKNGDAAAKLGDIKVGDTVSGSRIKNSATEYEGVKITNCGPAAMKAAVDKKAPAPAAPAVKKAN